MCNSNFLSRSSINKQSSEDPGGLPKVLNSPHYNTYLLQMNSLLYEIKNNEKPIAKIISEEIPFFVEFFEYTHLSTDPSWLVAFGYKAYILGSVHPYDGNGIRPDPTDSREVILSVEKYNICEG